MTAEQRRERAQKGGDAVMARYGKLHMTRLAYRRNGLLKEVTTSQNDTGRRR